MDYLAMGARGLIAAVFLVSAIHKVAGRTAFEEFVSSVRAMRLLPPRLVRPVARGVLASELAVCLLVATPPSRAAAVGLAAATGLLVAFTVAIVLAVRRQARVACRCFGASRTPIGTQHVVRNAALATVAAAAVVPVLASEPVQTGGLAVAVAAGVVLGGLVTVLDDILGLFRPVTRSG